VVTKREHMTKWHKWWQKGNTWPDDIISNDKREPMTRYLCHLTICSLFVTTYYVIWSCVPFCHCLLCHLVIGSLLSLLIMSSGHVFPFCHHLCHLVICSLFVTTYYVRSNEISGDKKEHMTRWHNKQWQNEHMTRSHNKWWQKGTYAQMT
jgi:hypothetical protein